jgi:predicted RNase H-like HicB family nuclease
MRSYIALIHKDPDSDYGVSFPDFPGCISAGSTIDEAKDMAHEALELHVEGMVEDGQALPEPSTLEVVMADDDNRDAVAFLVSLPEKPVPTVRVNITMSADDLKAIDAFAEAHGFTRSGFLVQAAKKAMKRRAA